MLLADANADRQNGGDRVYRDHHVSRDHQEDGDAHRGARGALRPREEDARRDHERAPQEGQVIMSTDRAVSKADITAQVHWDPPIRVSDIWNRMTFHDITTQVHWDPPIRVSYIWNKMTFHTMIIFSEIRVFRLYGQF